MEGILLPVCSIVFSLLLCIVFFAKKRIKLAENGIYGLMLVSILFDSILVSIAQGVTILNGINTPILFLSIINKFDFIMLIVFSSCIFIYTVLISIPKAKEKFKHIVLSVVSLDIVFYILILFSNIILINEGANYSIKGLAVVFTYLICGIYIILSILISLFYIKNVTKRHIPILSIILIAIFLFIIFQLNPYLIVISITLTFINYLMYFTIQNPDVRMMQEIEVAREQAEKANRAKTDFLSSMSHEIRTPLNAIVGFSDCIADAKNLGEAQENAKDIVNASQTLLEIVNGILDISKIEAGKIEITNTKYNAPETFYELAKLITPKMNEKGLEFTYKIAPDLPVTLFGDHANIKKIVTNLLSNACKYTDNGYVHYEVNCINTKNVSKLIISVEDSGRGIRKESIDKMFTKFQRLDEARNTTIEGTGLGLAITKQLIELMGGKIIVHTVFGEGSKFTVVLNQKITQSDVPPVKKVKTTLDLTGVKILMVDDAPLNLKVGKKLLEKYGANDLVLCASGFECIERINRGEIYDLILLDDMMPRMSGVETLHKLKENPNFSIPTIALTANAISGMREKYLADGFDDYLAKPIDQNQLIQVFNQVLGRSATEDINVSEVLNNNDNIRIEEIPNVEDQEKAEKEREINSDIIPVEDNIEELLGDQLDMNYKKKTVIDFKPITVDEIEILDEDAKVTKAPTVQTKTVPIIDIPPIPEIPNMPNLYDKEYLESNGVDVNYALELLGDMDMYNMTIADFMNDIEGKWSRIIQYKNTNNMSDYAIEVHSLKSDCKYLGFIKLANILYQHELKSKENDTEYVFSNFYLLEEEYKKVLEIAHNYVEHNVVEG